jgi:hypothetical protein
METEKKPKHEFIESRREEEGMDRILASLKKVAAVKKKPKSTTQSS